MNTVAHSYIIADNGARVEFPCMARVVDLAADSTSLRFLVSFCGETRVPGGCKFGEDAFGGRLHRPASTFFAGARPEPIPW